MLEELRLWLEKFLPLDRVDLYLSAFEALEDLNDLGAATEFSLLWQEKEKLYNGEMISSLHQILTVGTRKSLANHGIFLVEETSLPFYVKAVESIVWLNNTDDHDAVIQIFDTDESNVTKIATLFQYVNNDSLTQWEELVENVSDLFITKVLEDHYETRIIHNVEQQYDLGLLTRYDIKFQNRLYRQAVELGANPGLLDPVSLIEMFREQLSNWMPFSPRDAAIDLVGLVIFSSAEQKNLVKQTALLSERLYTDVGFLMALKSQISQVYGEIQVYG